MDKKFRLRDFSEEMLDHNSRKTDLVEIDPTSENIPEKPKFNWFYFVLFGSLMILAWFLGQLTPWFPDELAAELGLFALYSYLNTLGFKRNR
jgi:hypothetical protein